MLIIRSLPTTRRARAFAFVIGLLGTVGVSQPSMAVTIGFDGATPGTINNYVENGFQIDIARIINGQCATDPCLAINTNETTTLSKVGGGSFTLDSFYFYLAGMPPILTVTPYSGITALTAIVLDTASYAKNTGLTYSTPIANITSVVFENTGTGNIRVDDISVSSTPLPGALPLFATGLGVVGLLGWRRKRKSAAAIARA
jgi:hypothetical protein